MALARAGYGPLDHILEWTPRRMHAVLFIDARLRTIEAKQLLALHAMAAQGDPKEIRRAVKDEK